MRKVLIIFLIIILLALLSLMAIAGISIGNFEIASVRQIIESNEELEGSITRLSNKINTTYQASLANLDTSFKNLQQSKQKYQDMINYSTEEEIKAANQTEEYQIVFLWTKIGMHATKNNVQLQANVTTGSASGLYDISVMAIGDYISVSDFIYAIENDSELGFKIEDFRLVAYSQGRVQGEFVMKNIAINRESITAAAQQNAQTATNRNEELGITTTTGSNLPQSATTVITDDE